jgi:GR25 family glycosyltransferase involved in LPS biosynthesis
MMTLTYWLKSILLSNSVLFSELSVFQIAFYKWGGQLKAVGGYYRNTSAEKDFSVISKFSSEENAANFLLVLLVAELFFRLPFQTVKFQIFQNLFSCLSNQFV